MLVKARDVNRRIERLGGVAVRQVGSHRRYVVSYTDPDGHTRTAATTVAQHPGDIPTGTLRAIERDLEAAFGKGWLGR
jgi:predicted RNA binding protein YcfA (HicA-like mRNA interferase family)